MISKFAHFTEKLIIDGNKLQANYYNIMNDNDNKVPKKIIEKSTS